MSGRPPINSPEVRFWAEFVSPSLVAAYGMAVLFWEHRLPTTIIFLSVAAVQHISTRITNEIIESQHQAGVLSPPLAEVWSWISKFGAYGIPIIAVAASAALMANRSR